MDEDTVVVCELVAVVDVVALEVGVEVSVVLVVGVVV